MSKPLSPRKQTIAQHFGKADNYHQHAIVQQQVCQLLRQRITSQHQSSVLEIGAGSGQLTQLLLENITANEWHINELASAQTDKLTKILANTPNTYLHIGDGETLDSHDFKRHFSLIISANAIQWFDNPLGFIEQSAKRLTKNGQLLFNTFTPNNFRQIKQLTGQGLDYPSIEQWQAEIIRCGLTINEISVHQFDLTFETPYQILQHIKQTGVSTTQLASKERFIWTKSKLDTFIQNYQQKFGDTNGKVILSYEVLLMDLIKA